MEEQRIHNPIPEQNQAAAEPNHAPVDCPPPAAECTPSPPENAPLTATPKGGAPKGNSNNLTHSLRADRRQQLTRLVLGKLPKSLARVETDAYGYWRAIEAAVVETHGTISLTMAFAIDAAARWFRHGQAAAAWLIDHEGELDPAGKLAFSRAIADSATARDKAIERLRLDQAASDPWAALDAELARQGPPEAAPRAITRPVDASLGGEPTPGIDLTRERSLERDFRAFVIQERWAKWEATA